MILSTPLSFDARGRTECRRTVDLSLLVARSVARSDRCRLVEGSDKPLSGMERVRLGPERRSDRCGAGRRGASERKARGLRGVRGSIWGEGGGQVEMAWPVRRRRIQETGGSESLARMACMAPKLGDTSSWKFRQMELIMFVNSKEAHGASEFLKLSEYDEYHAISTQMILRCPKPEMWQYGQFQWVHSCRRSTVLTRRRAVPRSRCA